MKIEEAIEKKEMFDINYIYLPYLGKCALEETFHEGTGYSTHESIKVLNKERRDPNILSTTSLGTKVPARFDVVGDGAYGRVNVNLNLHAMKISGTYKKVWKGGEVEEFEFEYDLKVTREYLERETGVMQYDLTGE